MRTSRFTDFEKQTRKRLYGVWWNMIARCEKPDNQAYANYGGRGIKVCEEWHDFDEFFYWAIAHGYDGKAKQGQCTIDRIDNDGNYEPRNCRFTNMMMQAWNKRPSIRRPEVVSMDEVFDQIERFEEAII